MAGSYNHCVDDDGRLLTSEELVGMLENGGDVYEAVEEMYGMIWYLADLVSDALGLEQSGVVENARKFYQEGLELSPGLKGTPTHEVVQAQIWNLHRVCPHPACKEPSMHSHGTDERFRPRS